MNTQVTDFDAAEYLGSPEAQAEFITAAMETNNPSHIAHCIGIVARAKGMTQVARDAGLTREALYRGLSEKGDPRLSTLIGVLNALDIKLSAVA